MDDLFTTEVPPSVLAGAVLLDELVALGVSDIVCCPGSRSAPLAYAAARLEAEGRVRLHVRLDERSAGFFGLGIAKATRRAVAIITTSGTAVANLAPSLAEARFGYVPLIALTADRPSTLVGTGSNQTADQVGIFGTIPLNVCRISANDSSPEAWRAAVRRSVVVSEGRLSLRPGPVHLNIELVPPLIGDPGVIPWGVPFRVENAYPGRAVKIDPGPRTVIIAGDMPVDEGRWWAAEAERAQIPLLAEPSSNARSGSSAISGYRYLLSSFAPTIERVILAGHPTLSRPTTELLTRKDVEIIAVNPSGEWPDPGWAVSQVVPQVSLGMGDTAWMNKWVSADRSLRARMDADLVWSGQTVAAVVLNHLRDEDSLVLGASNPIRDADLAPLGSSPRIYSNRGLAGIDGTIATACGISAGSSGEVVALMGDLTALHDIGSLAQPSLEKTIDLTVVISDDHGGSLFSSLEYAAPASQIGELADYFERLFSVPMECDLTSVVRGFGLSVTEVSTPTQLSQALAVSKSGIRVIHCRLERSTRGDRDRKLASWGREAYKTRVN